MVSHNSASHPIKITVTCCIPADMNEYFLLYKVFLSYLIEHNKFHYHYGVCEVDFIVKKNAVDTFP